MGEKKHVLAIDLGHGETSAAYVNISKEIPAKDLKDPVDYNILPSKPVIPTAYARTTDGRELIGEDAIDNIGSLAFLYICFKKKPSLMTEADKYLIQGYFRCVVHSVININNIKIQDYQIVVGCPSSWNTKERKIYESILTDAIKSDFSSKVEVIKESKAAIVHAAKRDKERMIDGAINEGILVIDFGSSTTDITYIRGIDEPINIGFELGASRIEKSMVKYGMAHSENHLQMENALNSQQNRHVTESKLEFRCREAKEKYFSSSDDYGKNINVSFKIDKGVYFEFDYNKNSMDEILSTPMKFDNRNIDDCIIKRHIGFIDKITECSWKEFCFNIMLEVKNALAKEGREIGSVIVTGGASAMDFIRDYGKKIFGKDKFLPDPMPSLCISRGLAESCRADIRSRQMKEKVLNEVNGILRESYNELIKPFSEKVCNYLFTDLIKPKLTAWKDGKYSTLEVMTRAINQEAEMLKSSPAIQKLVQQELSIWLKKQSDKITKKVNLLFSQEYGSSLISSKVDVAGCLYNNVQTPSKTSVNFSAREYVDFEVGADISGVIASIIAWIVSAVVGFIISYIIVLIGLFIIGFIIGLTGVGLPVAIWIAGNAFWIAAGIAFAGGDIYEEIAENFGEGTTNVIKKMVGNPETKNYPLAKRKKYYDQIMKKEADIKENLGLKVGEQMIKDEDMRVKLLDSMDGILKQSIELAMRYASLEM